MPEAPSRGVPRRHVVRLPAPAAGRLTALGVRAAAQLDPPGLKARRGNSRPDRPVATSMAPAVSNRRTRTVHMPDMFWTARSVTCDPAVMSVTDPLLVVRRHVDFLRIRSAICRDTR